MKKVVLYSLAMIGGLSAVAFAQADKSKKEETKYVCEKKEKDGKEVRLDVKSKEECKQKGGLWVKDHVDDHKHTEGDKH